MFFGDCVGRKKWTVSGCDKNIAASVAEACEIDPFVAYLLCSRGYTDEFAVDEYLYDEDILDPFLLPDMEKAVQAIDDAVHAGKHITVFGDYDTDGVTSTALMYLYLESRGAYVDFFIPDRIHDGYGLNIESITLLKERGTQLIVTVDNGISAVDEVKYAKTLGIDVVVTDHHKPGAVLPDALAVVDAQRDDCGLDFKEWAGVGTAFKLVCALEDCDSEKILSEFSDIIALGTIADVVPLKGENRILVKNGLERLNRGDRMGIKALRSAAGYNDRYMSSVSVAFIIAPRINAAGRMGSAERAFRLLTASSEEEAELLSGEICEANNKRKTEEAAIEAAALEQLAQNPSFINDRVIVVDGENWHQGVIGIVAVHLCDRFGKPAVVISRENDKAKGSGRSLDGFSLYDAFSAVADTLEQYGGHTLAAGLGMNSSDIDVFRRRINEYAAGVKFPVPVLTIDCKLNPASLGLGLYNALNVLEPFGAGNPQPLFGLFGMTLTGIQPVGNGKHLRLSLKKNGTNIIAMYFGITPADFFYESGDLVDLAVRLDKNEYMGEEKLNIHIMNIRFADTDDDEIFGSMFLYDKFMRGEELSYEEAQRLLPDRALQEMLYRYIKGSGGCFADAEYLCRRLGLKEDRCGSVKVALDVFLELSLIEYSENNRIVPVKGIKADLESSRILSSLHAKGA